MSAKKAQSLGLTPLARIASYASADLDLLEINEAFAAQACAVHQEMGWDTSKVNVNGGAIAIGHPIGASGCRILVTLRHEIQRRGVRCGIASLCIGGGMGVALTVERWGSTMATRPTGLAAALAAKASGAARAKLS